MSSQNYTNEALADLHKYEFEAEEAYNSFRDLISDSTSCLSLLESKVRMCLDMCQHILKKSSEYQLESVKLIEPLPDEPRQIKINKLNNQLQEQMMKSNLSIRRSLLKFSNLMSQQELIFRRRGI
ncbi:uncharacterized protein LOC115889321 isoform X2 [Sitophilus oryzae]|uniref:Uncharacterized protein LOC115889321 isoform X2 n=1 Tax=Sitophilus oryzae TaxID=7048 RepID=A0A6J2YPE1_SITOR|nr:uncharacterized protein LOC115889321 isoform X2 [Sitophilus oryzae]